MPCIGYILHIDQFPQLVQSKQAVIRAQEIIVIKACWEELL